MELKFVEANQRADGAMSNWGKFAVGRFTEDEWAEPVHSPGAEDSRPLLRACGWARDHVWVLDVQTGEGIFVKPGGHAPADLKKHAVWVCPLFEPFLEWLYAHVCADRAGWWDAMPRTVLLPDAEFAFHGFRRPGPPLEEQAQVIELTVEEWRTAALARLADLGLTYEELEAQAVDGHFTSIRAKTLWMLIGGTL